MSAARPDIIAFVKQELAPFPGRYNTMLRYLLSSAIVIIISMALNVPQLSYSLLVIFFATQQNIVLTRAISPLFLLVNTLAVGYSILILKFTIDYPMLRLLTASVSLVLLMYLMRSSGSWGFLFFSVAIAITFTQSFVDQTSDGERLLRNCMWTWVAGCYATVVAHIVNTLFLPVEPVRQLQQEMAHILTQVSQSLETAASEKPVPARAPEAVQKRVLTLHKYMKFAVMRDASYRKDEALHLAEIAAAERLYAASGLLPSAGAAPLSQEAARHCRLLAQACRDFRQSAQEGKIYRPGLQQVPPDTLPECLYEMYSALLSIPQQDARQQVSAATSAPPASGHPGKGLSYDYLKFGVKTLLAVLVCYVFYTSVQWPGIHTSMLTCIIIAQPGLGASLQKSLLRICGCLAGSAIALFSTVFILPHVDGITGLLLMAAPVLALSGWITAGSERISYAGIQILFAWSLAMLAHFGPSPDIPEIRDRMMGILLGIVVATPIYTLLWPETEGRTLRQSLAGLCVYFSDRISTLKPDKHTQATGWAKLEATQNLLARVALEPNWRSHDNERLTLNCQILLGKLRELQVALYRLEIDHLRVAAEHSRSELLAFITPAMHQLATDLKAFARGLQSEPITSLAVGGTLYRDIRQERDVLRMAVTAHEKRLLMNVREVIRLCQSIPEWRTEDEAMLLKGK